MKKKTLFRVHYVAGYREIIFCKCIDIIPFYDLVIYNDPTSANTDVEFNLKLANNSVTTTTIYYNDFLKRYEVEIIQTVYEYSSLSTKETIAELISNFKSNKWKCETIQPDIELFIEYVATE